MIVSILLAMAPVMPFQSYTLASTLAMPAPMAFDLGTPDCSDPDAWAADVLMMFPPQQPDCKHPDVLDFGCFADKVSELQSKLEELAQTYCDGKAAADQAFNTCWGTCVFVQVDGTTITDWECTRDCERLHEQALQLLAIGLFGGMNNELDNFDASECCIYAGG